MTGADGGSKLKELQRNNCHFCGFIATLYPSHHKLVALGDSGAAADGDQQQEASGTRRRSDDLIKGVQTNHSVFHTSALLHKFPSQNGSRCRHPGA